MNKQALLELHTETVQPEWIDYNGHMNVAYYVLAFDHTTDAFLDYIGLGEAYRKVTECSVFILDANVTYDRELKQSDPLRFTTRLLDFDHKRLHYFHCMYHASEDFLAATTELLATHVNRATRRSEPMPEAVIGRLQEIMEMQRALPVPERVGRVLGIRRR